MDPTVIVWEGVDVAMETPGESTGGTSSSEGRAGLNGYPYWGDRDVEGFHVEPGRKHGPSRLWVSRVECVHLCCVSYLVCGSVLYQP